MSWVIIWVCLIIKSLVCVHKKPAWCSERGLYLLNSTTVATLRCGIIFTKGPVYTTFQTQNLSGYRPCVEEGEQRDCGLIESCQRYWCCTYGAKRVTGPCWKNCKFRQPHTLCREKNSECDLPEWCNGTSDEYPEDVYVKDGTPCSGGYWYKKSCNIHKNHCQKIFGMGARRTDVTCYMEINKQGDRFGNCGNNSMNTKNTMTLIYSKDEFNNSM